MQRLSPLRCVLRPRNEQGGFSSVPDGDITQSRCFSSRSWTEICWLCLSQRSPHAVKRGQCRLGVSFPMTLPPEHCRDAAPLRFSALCSWADRISRRSVSASASAVVCLDWASQVSWCHFLFGEDFVLLKDTKSLKGTSVTCSCTSSHS